MKDRQGSFQSATLSLKLGKLLPKDFQEKENYSFLWCFLGSPANRENLPVQCRYMLLHIELVPS